jgi:hypothetical protein
MVGSPQQSGKTGAMMTMRGNKAFKEIGCLAVEGTRYADLNSGILFLVRNLYPVSSAPLRASVNVEPLCGCKCVESLSSPQLFEQPPPYLTRGRDPRVARALGSGRRELVASFFRALPCSLGAIFREQQQGLVGGERGVRSGPSSCE